MICIYCNKECIKLSSSSRCLDCKTHYNSDCINLFCNIRGKAYCVQFLNNQTTIISGLPLYKHVIIAKINHVANINPTNIVDKLKTYLVFS